MLRVIRGEEKDRELNFRSKGVSPDPTEQSVFDFYTTSKFEKHFINSK